MDFRDMQGCRTPRQCSASPREATKRLWLHVLIPVHLLEQCSVQFCTCVCVCSYGCISVSLCACACVCVCSYGCISVSLCPCVDVPVCACAYVCVCSCGCISVCLCPCVCAHEHGGNGDCRELTSPLMENAPTKKTVVV